MNPGITAVVVSAGYSSRMSAHKALYPIGHELMIERIIRLLHDSGISSIHIVTGYKRDLLNRAVTGVDEGLQIRVVENPDFDNGMFSSVIAGVRSLPESVRGFIMLPVDYPFVEPDTIRNLVCSFDESDADVISPVCSGIPGHPPVIRRSVFSRILSDSGNRGLSGVLENPEFSILRLEVNDYGILTDVDDDESYKTLLKVNTGIDINYPSAAECGKILAAKNPGSRIVAHMKKTAELAVGFAERLNSCGCRLNPGLLYAAALLHDLCRSEPDHDKAAAEYLAGLGYTETALIVSQHMNISRGDGAEIDEAAVLYLADKMTEGDRITELQIRMDEKLRLYADNPEAQRSIRQRFEAAFLIKKHIEHICL